MGFYREKNGIHTSDSFIVRFQKRTESVGSAARKTDFYREGAISTLVISVLFFSRKEPKAFVPLNSWKMEFYREKNGIHTSDSCIVPFKP
jgi:hypothetical protein